MSSTLLKFWYLLILVSFAFGCDGGGDDDDDDVVDETTNQIRFVNAVPDSPILTVQINESSVANVSFGQSSAATNRNPGTYEVDIEYSLPGGLTQELIDDLEIDLDADEIVTVVASGPVESPEATIVESPVPDISSGDAEVEFFHAVTAEQRLDFYLTAVDTPLSSATPSATLGFREHSEIQSLTAGEWRLRVTHEGHSEVLYDSGPFDLNALTRRMLLAIDYFGPGGSGVRAVKIDPLSASTFPEEYLPTSLRVANLIADSIAVDVFGSSDPAEDPLWRAVSFSAMSDYIELPAGVADLLVTLENNSPAIQYSDSTQLIAGEQRTLVVAGLHADGSSSGRIVLDNIRRIATETQLRVVHGSSSTGAVDFYLLSPSQPVSDASPVFRNLSFLTNGYVSIEPGTYDIVFALEGEETILLGPERLVMEANGIYSLFFSDAEGGGTPSSLLLADDFAN